MPSTVLDPEDSVVNRKWPRPLLLRNEEFLGCQAGHRVNLMNAKAGEGHHCTPPSPGKGSKLPPTGLCLFNARPDSLSCLTAQRLKHDSGQPNRSREGWRKSGSKQLTEVNSNKALANLIMFARLQGNKTEFS